MHYYITTFLCIKLYITLSTGLANIIIPDDYIWFDKLTNEKFLLWAGESDDPDRSWIFSTLADLDRFSYAKTFLGDGTFKTPQDIYQVSSRQK